MEKLKNSINAMMFLFFVGFNGPAKASIIGESGKYIDTFTEIFSPEKIGEMALNINATMRDPSWRCKCNYKEIQKIKRQVRKFFAETFEPFRLTNPRLYRAIMRIVDTALKNMVIRHNNSRTLIPSHASTLGKVFVEYHNIEELRIITIHEIAHIIGFYLQGTLGLGFLVNEGEDEFRNSGEDVSLFFELLCTIKLYAASRSEMYVGFLNYLRVFQLLGSLLCFSTLNETFENNDSSKIKAETLKLSMETKNGTQLREFDTEDAKDKLIADAKKFKAQENRLIKQRKDFLKSYKNFGLDPEERFMAKVRPLIEKEVKFNSKSKSYQEVADKLIRLNEAGQKERDELEELHGKLQALYCNPKKFLMEDPKFRPYAEAIPSGNPFWLIVKPLALGYKMPAANSIELKNDERGDPFCELKSLEKTFVFRDSIFFERNTTSEVRENFVFNQYVSGLFNAVRLINSGQSIEEILNTFKGPHSEVGSLENFKNTCILLRDLSS
jgi:hypothetical protein